MKYTVDYSNLFKKSFKRSLKRGLDPLLFQDAIALLMKDGCLPPRYKQHQLSGKYKGCWECHIKPDGLLIWEQDNELLRLLLIDTGTHSDLFG